MNKDIIRIDNSEIVCYFTANGKNYCALIDKDTHNGEVYFALRTNVDENNCALTSVPGTEIDAVINEYNKLIDFFETEDELDFEEDYNE